MTLAMGDNPVPLRIDEDGVVRVNGTRVPLDIIVDAFQDGASAEEIVIRYPTLRLTDVYAVIAYYLHHQTEVDAYLEGERALDDQARQDIEAGPDMIAIRERLLTRQSAKRS
ncbi:MAG TPA: DUF433 domain-containing protein [Chloroflexia bacterium]|nr:DUF433 domain-containing protein [Chloroflexia bacterium]